MVNLTKNKVKKQQNMERGLFGRNKRHEWKNKSAKGTGTSHNKKQILLQEIKWKTKHMLQVEISFSFSSIFFKRLSLKDQGHLVLV